MKSVGLTSLADQFKKVVEGHLAWKPGIQASVHSLDCGLCIFFLWIFFFFFSGYLVEQLVGKTLENIVHQELSKTTTLQMGSAAAKTKPKLPQAEDEVIACWLVYFWY